MKEQMKRIFLTILIIIIFLPYTYCLADSKNSNTTSTENTENININSEAAILIDDTTGKILYEKNKDERRYPASTTKILTAILAIENCDLSEKATASYNSVFSVPSGYANGAIQVGEELTVEQLLQMLLVHSANDAANVLAEHIGGSIESFASIMNTKAQEIGCVGTHFTNPSGIHDDNHYTTASDLALIMQYCMKNPTFKSMASNKSCTIEPTNKYEKRYFSNTDKLFIEGNYYYYKYAIAGKTGYTSEAQNCLVSCANKDGFGLTCAILGATCPSSTTSYRFIDTKTLFEYGFNNYAIKKIHSKGDIVKNIEISNATQDTKSLDLRIENDISVLVKKNENVDNFTPNIELNDNLFAPIAESQVCGTISYTIDGIDYKSDLQATHNVDKSKLIEIIAMISILIVVLFILYKLIASKKKKKRKNRWLYK